MIFLKKLSSSQKSKGFAFFQIRGQVFVWFRYTLKCLSTYCCIVCNTYYVCSSLLFVLKKSTLFWSLKLLHLTDIYIIIFILFYFEFSHDYLAIYDGASKAFPMLGKKYCGTSAPPNLHSSGTVYILGH